MTVVHELKEHIKSKGMRIAVCGAINKTTSSDIAHVTCIRCRPEIMDIPASWGWKNSSEGRRL